jgi:hypothetical protein
MNETTTRAVRDLLGRWAKSLPNHPYADFADKVAFSVIAEKPVFIVRLMTRYDIRGDEKDGFLPCPEGEPPPSATDVWSVEVNLEKDYIRHETRVSLPVSTEPKPCVRCEGGGSLRCKTCHGSKSVTCPECTSTKRKACTECGGLGKIACVHCQGKGVLLSDVSAMGQERSSPCQTCAGTGGPPCPKWSSDTECPTCQNKRFVSCKECEGTGGLKCPDCLGNRNVFKARSYQVEFQPIFEREIRPDPESPQGLLPAEPSREVLGAIAYELEADKITELGAPLPDEDLKGAVDALLKRAEAGRKRFPSEARIIKQKLTIDRIPAYSVVYEFGGRKYACWATSLENKVVAAESPFTDLAGQWLQEASKSLSSNGYAKAEELFAKAEALAPWPFVGEFKRHIDQHKGLSASPAVKRLDLDAAGAPTISEAWSRSSRAWGSP